MKLLVIEDDRKIAQALRRGLEGEGFQVEVSNDGDDGLWRATEGSYDAIVLDIMLPGKNGFQVCAALRARDDWTPILMLTAKDGELDEAEGLDTGADDYLTKPFAFPVLVARLRALLRRVRERPAPILAGRLVVDSAGRTATYGGAAIQLTSREFDVLEFLVRRGGAVASKADILRGVWEDDFDGDPNVVEVYVRRLRRKIDERFGCSVIDTVRGSGYRLAAQR